MDHWNQTKEEDIRRFNELAGDWNRKAPPEALQRAVELIRRLQVDDSRSLLDVASGTGVLRDALEWLGIEPVRYLAVDIAPGMLEELKRKYPKAGTVRLDFEEDAEQAITERFDLVLLYNSIPHFQRLEAVFGNAQKLLKPGGRFAIAHSRTRAGLREHHRRIGYQAPWEPIPSDERLMRLSEDYGFRVVCMEDKDFLMYCGEADGIPHGKTNENR